MLAAASAGTPTGRLPTVPGPASVSISMTGHSRRHDRISRLRKALGSSAGSLETHGRGYRLVDIRLDIDVVSAGLHDASSLGDDDRLHALTRLLECWRGEPLTDIELARGRELGRVWGGIREPA